MNKIHMNRLPFFQWSWFVKILLMLIVMMFVFFVWCFFILREYSVKQPLSLNSMYSIQNGVGINADAKLLLGLKKAWIDNPYKKNSHFSQLFQSFGSEAKKYNVDLLEISQQIIKLAYQGKPSSILSFLWYYKYPAPYLKFSTIRFECKKSNSCHISFSLQASRAIENKDVQKNKMVALLKKYFQHKAFVSVKLPDYSVYQSHMSAYFHYKQAVSALVGNSFVSSDVHVGDVVGLERAKVVAIDSHYVMLVYDGLAHRQNVRLTFLD